MGFNSSTTKKTFNANGKANGNALDAKLYIYGFSGKYFQ